MWAMLVADFGLSPGDAWNTTTYEYHLLWQIKYGEPQEAKRKTLSRTEAQELRAVLDAEIAKERRQCQSLTT